MEYPERDCLDGSSSKALRATIAQQQADIEALIRFAEAYGNWPGDGCEDCSDMEIQDIWLGLQPIIARYRAEGEALR
jgi:hypothetical protein